MLIAKVHQGCRFAASKSIHVARKTERPCVAVVTLADMAHYEPLVWISGAILVVVLLIQVLGERL